MLKGDSATIERIIANTINETARAIPTPWPPASSPALAEVGYCIVPEDTALVF
jgi:hypothetical protein